MKRILPAAVLLGLAACGSAGTTAAPGPPPQVMFSCGVSVVSAQTGISVVMWQAAGTRSPVFVRQVTADWYGSTVTVKTDRSVPPGGGITEVDQPLPPSLYANSTAKGCKVLSWK